MTDRIAEPWGARTPYAAGQPWPERVDTELTDGLGADEVDWAQSAAVLHSNGDGIDIAAHDGRIVGVRGRRIDRVNHGRVDPKDLFGWQANNSPDRLTVPLVRENGRLVESDWDTAMDRIVSTTQALLRDIGPSAIGFYTSGQLMLEEYYTLGVIARAGLGTNHIDGNTRLCTATAEWALKETFGCDGQPGSYTDVDHADVIALFGHNVAETQTVLWSRMLDRLAGADPPQIICVDPRETPVAKAATVHLAPVPGTNLALMNGLLHEVIANDWVDHDYVAAHTVGYHELAACVAQYPPERVAKICDVPVGELRRAAEILGHAQHLLSTVLQGFYQSHQATAASVQVNNLNLIRGMLGRPGAGILQMNGQPTAQNTRECGANGDLPGFRNWRNDAHIAELARLWNVDMAKIPHYSEPTHAMQMLRFAEQGSLRMLWVSATNPAVSLPELHRIRHILGQSRLLLVVQDIFATETAELADVVLPAAAWGEKTGTFTNADRTVHISDKAVDPPGQARSDLEIFCDYAERMGFTDRDGAPLISWNDPESAFAAWQRCSAGRPCDYTGLSYEKLRGGSGIQWPCNEENPDGTERLYTDGDFYSRPSYCESYGKDLLTGAAVEPTAYRAANPDGKAMLRAAGYTAPHERPADDDELWLTTGRTVYQFHSRTKTGRAPQLNDAAPEVWVQLSAGDAGRRGIGDGDMAEIRSARGSIRARARIGGIRDGVAFVPFHYGYWDTESADHHRAANELTITDWDPVSKQPLFKTSVVRIHKSADTDRSGW